ncbi:activation of GTPase activity protein, partial [Homalodisca vitripennis]
MCAGSPTTTHRQQTHSLLRSSLKPGTISSYYTASRNVGQNLSTTSTLSRRQRTLDYASDTEATCPSTQRSSYYYYRDRPSATVYFDIGSKIINYINLERSTYEGISAKQSGRPPTTRSINIVAHKLSNPFQYYEPYINHSTRYQSQIQLSAQRQSRLKESPPDPFVSSTYYQGLSAHFICSTRQSSGVRFERDSRSLLDQDDSDGALSAPELPIARRKERDEYRAWLSRAPSTSAIYERIRAGRDGMLRQQKAAQRFTFSAENLPERTRQSELLYSSYRPGQLATMGPITPTG